MRRALRQPLALALLLAAAPASAQVSVGVRAGTLGIGPEVAVALGDRVAARLAGGFFTHETTYDETGIEYDADYNSWQEGKNGANGNPTYASVLSRSWHTGGVQTLLADGSVRFISDSIDLAIWRGLGTRQGGEILGDF